MSENLQMCFLDLIESQVSVDNNYCGSLMKDSEDFYYVSLAINRQEHAIRFKTLQQANNYYRFLLYQIKILDYSYLLKLFSTYPIIIIS